MLSGVAGPTRFFPGDLDSGINFLQKGMVRPATSPIGPRIRKAGPANQAVPFETVGILVR